MAKLNFSGKKQKRSVLNRTIDFFFNSNYHAYLVGGYVRDNAIGIEPVDIDIVLEGDAIVAARKLNTVIKGDLWSYRDFGTATIIAENERIDLASARTERYPNSAKLPAVYPSTIIHDLNRRDFTINAIAMSIARHNFGEIFDPFNGLDDIRKGLIRVLHRNSFIDDPTRLLRAFRYKNRFNFRFEEKTRQLIGEGARLKLINRLSGQRILNEMNLIFDEDDPGRTIRELSSHKLFPLSAKNIRMVERLDRDGRYYFIAHIDHSKLPLSSQEKVIVNHLQNLESIIKKLAKTRRPSSVFRALDGLDESVHRVLSILQPGLSDKVKNYQRLKKIKPFINGKDLMRAGHRRGPSFTIILRRLFDQQLDGKIASRKQALARIKAKNKK